MNGLFFFNAFLLGAGLAMDAFSVSIANGLREPHMTLGRMCAIAGVYAWFQAMMPVTGWFLVGAAAEQFRWFARCVPWIGAGLLGWIGAKMLAEGLRGGDSGLQPADESDAMGNCENDSAAVLTPGALLLQGVATSIDALSVGFALASYRTGEALTASAVIAAVTFCLCMGGLKIGRRFGELLSDRASVCGGLILIGIGVEMLLRAVLG